MNKITCKYNCENCINRNIIVKKYNSMIVGIIDKSYCLNAKHVIFENCAKNETEIYCKNYNETKKEDD